MSLIQELSSFRAPSHREISPISGPGSKAPSCPQLSLPIDGKPTIIAFLRHCGCPVAEATYLNLHKSALQNPTINFIAISHSDTTSTNNWLNAINPDPNTDSPVRVIVDTDRSIYAKWGLGTTSWSHVLSPAGLYSIWKLGQERGIWNRPTESGSRWQSGGSWAVDGRGYVRWGGPAVRVDDVIDVDEAIGALKTYNESFMKELLEQN